MSSRPYSQAGARTANPLSLQEEHDKQQTRDKLENALNNTREILVSATTVFPFNFFPDTITVDRTSLTVTRRSFFMMGTTLSIRIEDILNVTANVGPIFGSIYISSRFFDNTDNKPHNVKHLWRGDALKITRICQGYLTAIKQKIDTSNLDCKELAQMLDNLGKGITQHQI
jgi:hypothetical protein